jgi:hypothetical protein
MNKIKNTTPTIIVIVIASLVVLFLLLIFISRKQQDEFIIRINDNFSFITHEKKINNTRIRDKQQASNILTVVEVDELTKLMHPGGLFNTTSFVSSWRPLKSPYFSFTNSSNNTNNEQLNTIYQAASRTFGHITNHNVTLLTIEYILWNPHGFGSELFSFVLDVMNIMLTRPSSTLALVDDRTNRGSYRPLQFLYLDIFAFGRLSHSIIKTLPPKCQVDLSQCESLTERGQSFPVMWQIQRENNELFHSLRVGLIRGLFQMENQPFQEMQQLFQQQFKDLLLVLLLHQKEENVIWETSTIAIHVRRTDKLSGEAQLTPMLKYLDSLQTVIMSSNKLLNNNLNKQLYHIIILTDEAKVEQELHQALLNNSFFNNIGQIIMRISNGRPEQMPYGNGRRVFLSLLADIKAAVMVKWFVGTQTSNLSNLICLLRGGDGCINAESTDGIWNIRNDKISL